MERGREPLELCAPSCRGRIDDCVLDACAASEGNTHDVEEHGEGMTPRLAFCPRVRSELDVGVDEPTGAERQHDPHLSGPGEGESRRGDGDRCSDAYRGEPECVSHLVDAVLLARPLEQGKVGELLQRRPAGEPRGQTSPPGSEIIGGSGSAALAPQLLRQLGERSRCRVPPADHHNEPCGQSACADGRPHHRSHRSSWSSLGETSGRDRTSMVQTPDAKMITMTASAS